MFLRAGYPSPAEAELAAPTSEPYGMPPARDISMVALVFAGN